MVTPLWNEILVNRENLPLLIHKSPINLIVKSGAMEIKNHQLGLLFVRDWYRTDNALLVNVVRDDAIVPAKLNLKNMALQVLSEKSGSCSTLDEQDNLYLNHADRVTQVNIQGQEVLLWQPPSGQIEMIAVGSEYLVVETRDDKKVHLWRVALSDSRKQQRVAQSDGLGLADVSSDGSHVLLHSKVTRSRAIVMLQPVADK